MAFALATSRKALQVACKATSKKAAPKKAAAPKASGVEFYGPNRAKWLGEWRLSGCLASVALSEADG
ncbi:hypothetical protein GPECTOR_212g428 [Gonium pectorale]|uniref:Chlorophyll a-b binding protein, chloroplastic n=1 Tax=Gonium pectorale TaxID=33097 RepID=A0A150FWW5_GONPE|nr:hypothetical protein GPECTOR_212g428 [Gonium pectorale]|eukprot:KXZ42068.1 hypothetical protein GPECTOR_212g428 [Gonium pectorale]